MMEDFKLKIVEFWKYCDKCKHCFKNENETPCFDCLRCGARPGTRVPQYFEEGC